MQTIESRRLFLIKYLRFRNNLLHALNHYNAENKTPDGCNSFFGISLPKYVNSLLRVWSRKSCVPGLENHVCNVCVAGSSRCALWSVFEPSTKKSSTARKTKLISEISECRHGVDVVSVYVHMSVQVILVYINGIFLKIFLCTVLNRGQKC